MPSIPSRILCAIEWLLAGVASIVVLAISLIGFLLAYRHELDSAPWMGWLAAGIAGALAIGAIAAGFGPESFKFRYRILARFVWVATVIAWVSILVTGWISLTLEQSRWKTDGLALVRPADPVPVPDDQNVVAALREIRDKLPKVQDPMALRLALYHLDLKAVADFGRNNPDWRKLAAQIRAAERRPQWQWMPRSPELFEPDPNSSLAKAILAIMEVDALDASQAADRGRAVDDLVAMVEICNRAGSDMTSRSGVLVSSDGVDDVARMARLIMTWDDNGTEKIEPGMRKIAFEQWAPKPIAEDFADEISIGRMMTDRLGATAVLDGLGIGLWDQAIGLRYARERYEARTRLPLRDWPTSDPKFPFWAMAARTAASDLGKSTQAQLLASETRRIQALIAIALKRWKKTYTKYPDRLSVLPEVPNDPATGLPMKYELVGDEFRLTGACISREEGTPIIWDSKLTFYVPPPPESPSTSKSAE